MMVSAPNVPAGDYSFLVQGVANGVNRRSIATSHSGEGGGGGTCPYVVNPPPYIDHISSPDGQSDPATVIAGTSNPITITGHDFGVQPQVWNLMICQAGFNPYDPLHRVPCLPADMAYGFGFSFGERNDDSTIHPILYAPTIVTVSDFKVWDITLNCVSGAIAYDHPGAIKVYDATPSIQSVTQSTDSNGSTILTISGTSFAQSGTVNLCALPGSGPCIQVGGDIRWGAPIAITLTGTLASLLQLISGSPCVTVTTTGITGTFRPAPNGGSLATSPCFALQTADVTITPDATYGNPGDIFSFTATGTSSAGTGSYTWSLGGENPGSFQFVATSCSAGSSCPAVSPDSCVGAQSCTVHVQAISTGFVNAGVLYQTQFAASPQKSSRGRYHHNWNNEYLLGPIPHWTPPPKKLPAWRRWVDRQRSPATFDGRSRQRKGVSQGECDNTASNP